MTATEREASPPTPAQMGRKHVFIINSAPEFLDLARVLLQRQDYNVTTTNQVPLTWDMIEAACPDALVVDLAAGEAFVWDLLGRLAAESSTAPIPLVLTATDPALLDLVHGIGDRAGGRFLLARPFNPADLADVLHALVGPA